MNGKKARSSSTINPVDSSRKMLVLVKGNSAASASNVRFVLDAVVEIGAGKIRESAKALVFVLLALSAQFRPSGIYFACRYVDTDELVEELNVCNLVFATRRGAGYSPAATCDEKKHTMESINLAAATQKHHRASLREHFISRDTQSTSSQAKFIISSIIWALLHFFRSIA